MRSKHSDAPVLLRRLSARILLAHCTPCQFFSASPLPLARRCLLLFSPRGWGGEKYLATYISPPRSLPLDGCCQRCRPVSHPSLGADRRSLPGFLGFFFFWRGLLSGIVDWHN